MVVAVSSVVAWLVGQIIESSALSRTTSITSLYVESFIEPLVQSLATGPALSPSDVDGLHRLLTETQMGQQIVSFRIWSLDGEILYSPAAELVGQHFPMDGDRGEAASGNVIGDLSDLSSPENAYERQRWQRLIEMYLPVRQEGSPRIIAVTEFYQLPDELEAEVARDRLVAWGAVIAAAVVAYLALARVVRGGSETIIRQESELRRQLGELERVIAQNAALDGRVRQAASRTIALNELERRRISSDLHDGPSQALGLALLRFDAVVDRPDQAVELPDPDAVALRQTLREALDEMRTIAAGLRIPEVEKATLPDIVRRVVETSARRTDAPIETRIGDLPDHATAATKIATYRILQEALSNAIRHGGGVGVRVAAETGADGALAFEVSDAGPGFDPSSPVGDGHLGLAGMRERAELLGGTFEIESAPGAGTVVRVRLPADREGGR